MKSAVGVPTIEEQLAIWEANLKSAVDTASRLTGNLTDFQFNWRPPSNGWTVGQTLDHLNLSNAAILYQMTNAVEAQKDAANQLRWKADISGRIFLKMLKPGGMIVPVPPIFEPSGEHGNRDLFLANFVEQHSALSALLKQCAKLDFNKIYVKSAAAPMKANLGSWFEGANIHDSYHLDQIAAIIANPIFPPG